MRPDAAESQNGSQRLGGYLRRLREGYGYSLRRVEERARAEGGEIDNSQLSRYEKGICYPSFDKLRVLASVFNVSIQSFSDVVELDAYEEMKPASGDHRELLAAGVQALQSGDSGRAFACFDRALELLHELAPAPGQAELVAELRVHEAIALARLGKVSLAEQELRQALRFPERLPAGQRIQALVTLASLHAQQGERFLAELEAGRALEMARAASEDRMAVMSLHILAKVLHEQGRHTESIERFRETAAMYERSGNVYEATRVQVNLGAGYVALGKFREGVRVLREACERARTGGHRRLEALAWSHIGEAFFRAKDPTRAKPCFRQSDALASYNQERHPDILFVNAFYEWKMATDEDNPTRVKIALGRLKALRASTERRTPEVEEFDRYVERRHAHA